MRKLILAGLAVASLSGIAYAQAADQDAALIKWLTEYSRQRRGNAPTCVDATGATRQPGETTSIGSVQFRCAETFGARLPQVQIGADWVLATPDTVRLGF